MSVPSEPFAAVYEDRNRLGVIVARTGRGGFGAYAGWPILQSGGAEALR
jgi:hypothetical protein